MWVPLCLHLYDTRTLTGQEGYRTYTALTWCISGINIFSREEARSCVCVCVCLMFLFLVAVCFLEGVMVPQLLLLQAAIESSCPAFCLERQVYVDPGPES